MYLLFFINSSSKIFTGKGGGISKLVNEKLFKIFTSAIQLEIIAGKICILMNIEMLKYLPENFIQLIAIYNSLIYLENLNQIYIFSRNIEVHNKINIFLNKCYETLESFNGFIRGGETKTFKNRKNKQRKSIKKNKNYKKSTLTKHKKYIRHKITRTNTKK